MKVHLWFLDTDEAIFDDRGRGCEYNHLVDSVAETFEGQDSSMAFEKYYILSMRNENLRLRTFGNNSDKFVYRAKLC
ncbi:hypothetical protein StoSoilB19_10150 [Arthrobacter sp. StoSoilB19]|nr:hypothetical protein StoSoilB19_10150 [Arthrobacter sp. StoSoilB19]